MLSSMKSVFVIYMSILHNFVNSMSVLSFHETRFWESKLYHILFRSHWTTYSRQTLPLFAKNFLQSNKVVHWVFYMFMFTPRSIFHYHFVVVLSGQKEKSLDFSLQDKKTKKISWPGDWTLLQTVISRNKIQYRLSYWFELLESF